MATTGYSPRTNVDGAPVGEGDGRSSRVNAAVSRARRLGPFTFLVSLLAILVVMPMGILLVATFSDLVPRPGAGVGRFTLEHYQGLTQGNNPRAFGNTLTLGFFGGFFSVVVGTTMAWLAARTDVPARWLAQLAGIAPLFTSALVGAVAWSILAAPNRGYLNLLLDELGIEAFRFNIYSLGGMVFIFTLYYSPYVFVLVNGALSLMNPELEEAAAVHGGRFRQVYFRITLRLITPAILGSATLVSVLIMENFSVPQILGAPVQIPTVPAQIYRYVTTSPTRPNLAGATGMVLLIITAGAIYFQRRIIAAREYTTVTGKGLKPYMTRLGAFRWVAFAFVVLYILLAVGLPFFALGQASLRTTQFVSSFSNLFDPEFFTLRHYREMFALPAFRLGFRNSIISSSGAALLGVVLFIWMAWTTQRSAIKSRSTVEYLANWPLAVPSLVIGLGFLWTWILIPIPIYGTLWILIFVYIVRFMPQGYRGISTSLAQIHAELEESARVCGASPMRATAKVTIPLIRTGVASTALLIFVLSFRELSAALFLITTGTRVLSIVIYESWDSGVWPRVASISVTYSIFLLAVTVVARRWFGVKQT